MIKRDWLQAITSKMIHSTLISDLLKMILFHYCLLLKKGSKKIKLNDYKTNSDVAMI